MKKIKILSPVAHATKILHKDSTHELPDDVADSLVKRKLAREVIEPAPKSKEPPAKPE